MKDSTRLQQVSSSTVVIWNLDDTLSLLLDLRWPLKAFPLVLEVAFAPHRRCVHLRNDSGWSNGQGRTGLYRGLLPSSSSSLTAVVAGVPFKSLQEKSQKYTKVKAYDMQRSSNRTSCLQYQPPATTTFRFSHLSSCFNWASHTASTQLRAYQAVSANSWTFWHRVPYCKPVNRRDSLRKCVWLLCGNWV